MRAEKLIAPYLGEYELRWRPNFTTPCSLAPETCRRDEELARERVTLTDLDVHHAILAEEAAPNEEGTVMLDAVTGERVRGGYVVPLAAH